MKKYALLLSLLPVLHACGDNSSSHTTSAPPASASPATEEDCARLQLSYDSLVAVNKELQMSYDAAIIHMDTLVGYKNVLEQKLIDRNKEISELKQLLQSRPRKQH